MCRSAAPKGPAMGHANRDGTRRSSTRPSKPATALRGDPMGKDLILTINPGTTTTRIGLFAPQSGQVQPLLEETVEHDEAVVAGFPSIAAQLEYRAAALQDFLAAVPGGVRLAAVAGEGGRIVDSSNRMEVSPFSPERAGGLPPIPLIELCYSGRYDKPTLMKRLYGQGGAFAYLCTKDMRRVEAMIAAGDGHAALIYDAMLYQVGRAIGAMAAVLDFAPDGLILTGGMAHSARVVEAVRARCRRLGPPHLYSPSDQSRALAEGAARVLAGQETPMMWPIAQEASAW